MFETLFELLSFGCNSSRKEVEDVPQDKYTLVLDLDETLIHSKLKSHYPDEKIIQLGGQEYFVAARPYLTFFLGEISKYYTIVIYTTGIKEYAEAIIKAFGVGKYIKYILHRDQCVEINEELFTKDISFLDVPMDKILLVDDNEINSVLQPRNFLRIKKFVGSPSDEILLKMIPFLKDLASTRDVRDSEWKYEAFLKAPKKCYPSKRFASNESDPTEKEVNKGNEEFNFSFEVSRDRLSAARVRFTCIQRELPDVDFKKTD